MVFIMITDNGNGGFKRLIKAFLELGWTPVGLIGKHTDGNKYQLISKGRK